MFRIKRKRDPEKVQDLLSLFTVAMHREFQANEHKQGWVPGRLESMDTIKMAVADISYHTAKLMYSAMEGNKLRQIEHAADIANCALIVADMCGALSTKHVGARMLESDFSPHKNPTQVLKVDVTTTY